MFVKGATEVTYWHLMIRHWNLVNIGSENDMNCLREGTKIVLCATELTSAWEPFLIMETNYNAVPL